MKTINKYILSKIKNETNITEKLRISKSNLKLVPETLEELVEMIKSEIKKNGNSCSLNHIDVSEITDMACLFGRYDYAKYGYGLENFNGDISEWNVSNVTNMYGLFWNNSKFNGDISKWNISKVENMKNMFGDSNFNNNSICNWNVSKVKNMALMFASCEFNYDISHWKINPNCDTNYMFNGSKIEGKFKPYQNGKRIY